jgi:acyl-CoA thioesterase-2
LAYVADFHLLSTALLPHRLEASRADMVMASIDHVMWFHWPPRVDDWLLYATDSPSASGARGFARGSIYSRAGQLVASTAQEGLMRLQPAAGG